MQIFSVFFILITFHSGLSADIDPETKAATLQKLTFTPNADGTVRQFWEQSTNDGKTRTVAFDGLYVRKAD
jgi:hypothetical protein